MVKVLAPAMSAQTTMVAIFTAKVLPSVQLFPNSSSWTKSTTSLSGCLIHPLSAETMPSSFLYIKKGKRSLLEKEFVFLLKNISENQALPNPQMQSVAKTQVVFHNHDSGS